MTNIYKCGLFGKSKVDFEDLVEVKKTFGNDTDMDSCSSYYKDCGVSVLSNIPLINNIFTKTCVTKKELSDYVTAIENRRDCDSEMIALREALTQDSGILTQCNVEDAVLEEKRRCDTDIQILEESHATALQNSQSVECDLNDCEDCDSISRNLEAQLQDLEQQCSITTTGLETDLSDLQNEYATLEETVDNLTTAKTVLEHVNEGLVDDKGILSNLNDDYLNALNIATDTCEREKQIVRDNCATECEIENSCCVSAREHGNALRNYGLKYDKIGDKVDTVVEMTKKLMNGVQAVKIDNPNDSSKSDILFTINKCNGARDEFYCQYTRKGDTYYQVLVPENYTCSEGKYKNITFNVTHSTTNNIIPGMKLVKGRRPGNDQIWSDDNKLTMRCSAT
jgi:hypothetical protein